MSAARASLGRWARAVTWRRVGIGIGGAGSQSYVAIPFIRRLEALGVPIDVISGSSTGAFIGAFYSAFGDAGLDQMISKRHHFGFAVAASWYHNAPFELLLTYLLDGLDLNDLELPVIAVAARAADGETAYLSSPLAGRACMASGSLPPMVPTYVRNRRLLDGGLTLDVPTAILTSAGAELIVGVQPIPRVNPRPLVDTDVFMPPNLRLLATINPLQRSLDIYRSYLMLFRQAARGYEPNADVVYEATTRETHAALFAYGAGVVADAERSDALALAVERTLSEWRRMLARAPGRVTFEPTTGSFELGSASKVVLGVAQRPCEERLSLHAATLVQQGAAFIARHPELGLRVVLHVPEHESEALITRWQAVLDAALANAGCRVAPVYERVRVAAARSLEFELAVIPQQSDAQPVVQSTSSGDAAQSDSAASSSA
jgi:predicted acylesterase/phospholipase RssA